MSTSAPNDDVERTISECAPAEENAPLEPEAPVAPSVRGAKAGLELLLMGFCIPPLWWLTNLSGWYGVRVQVDEAAEGEAEDAALNTATTATADIPTECGSWRVTCVCVSACEAREPVITNPIAALACSCATDYTEQRPLSQTDAYACACVSVRFCVCLRVLSWQLAASSRCSLTHFRPGEHIRPAWCRATQIVDDFVAEVRICMCLCRHCSSTQRSSYS